MTVSSNVLLALSLVVTSTAFAPASTSTNSNVALYATSSSNESNRRQMLQKSIIPALTVASVGLIGGGSPLTASARTTGADNPSNQYAPDFVQKYEDFQPSPEGWQFKDVKIGTGELKLETGDRAVFDWSGYTIGYFGRPFEAKGGPQGGAFDKDLDFSRTVIGSGTVVSGVEKALMDMKPGGVRQVVIPYGPLSYPAGDLEHTKVGPKPSTFSGQRALNFVLENPRVDRTLLFNVKLVRIDKANGKGGFIRG